MEKVESQSTEETVAVSETVDKQADNDKVDTTMDQKDAEINGNAAQSEKLEGAVEKEELEEHGDKENGEVTEEKEEAAQKKEDIIEQEEKDDQSLEKKDTDVDTEEKTVNTVDSVDVETKQVETEVETTEIKEDKVEEPVAVDELPDKPPSYNDVQEDDRTAEEEPRLPTPEPEAERERTPTPEPEPEPEPEVVPEVPETPQHNYHPRLCHIRKWPDFQGYGFNLHSEKDKPGQLIGLVDEGSPAEEANLRKGDRIIEVNGVNIEQSSHQEVIMKIKEGGDETKMLVVDPEADEYYKNNGITVTTDLPECLFFEAKPRQTSYVGEEPEMSYTPRLCHIIKWHDFNGYGFNLHAEKERGAQYIGKIDDNSPAQDGGLQENDRIIEVNGVNIENETHSQVISRIKAGGDETRMLVVDKEADAYYKRKGITVTGSMPEVKKIQTTRREASVSAPSVTNGNTVQPAPTRVEPAPATTQPAQAQANGGDVLSMKMSAAEMRAMLQSKKKNDPKQRSNMDFRSKYEIFQQM